MRIERLRAGVSSRELAKALRVTKTTVCNWETGKRKVSDGMREKIRKYLLTMATRAA